MSDFETIDENSYDASVLSAKPIRVESALDMVASYGRALAWSTELVNMLVIRARKICS